MDDREHARIEELIERTLRPDGFPHYPRPAEAEGIGPAGTDDLIAQAATELEGFRIDGDRTALWAHRRWAEWQRVVTQAAETADQLRHMAAEYERAAHAQADNHIGYFEGLLHRYTVETVGDRSRSRYVTLPNGARLTLRKGSVTTVVTDEDAAVAALEDLDPDALDLKVTVKKAVVKDQFGTKIDEGRDPASFPAVTADGEVVPGVHFERGPERFDVGEAQAATDPAE